MIRHALIQYKPYKARLERNLEKLTRIFTQLKGENIDVMTLPETALSGYFLQAGVREQALEASAAFGLFKQALQLAGWTEPVDLCFGAFERQGGDFYNSALYCEFNTPLEGIRHIHRKMFPPTYGVFDEDRYVARGSRLEAFDTRFGKAGILICEDAWHSSTAAVLALKGAEILYIPNASPAREMQGELPGNVHRWHATAQGIASEHGVFVVTTSLVGFEGGKGFLGYSHVIDPYGKTIAQAPLTHEHILITDIHPESIQAARYESPLLADLRSNLPELLNAFSEVETGKDRA
jgi:N-carbamoylputrescine amidase